MTKTDVVMTITGMRSHKLFGRENYNDPRYISLIKEMIKYIHNHPEIRVVNNGMATGTDLLFALAVIKYNSSVQNRIILNCYIPGKNQTEKYSKKEKEIYSFILSKAHNIIQLTQKKCTPQILKERNKKMVQDGTNRVLSFWDYTDFRSGTYMTMNYARKKNITVYNINPKNLNEKGFFFISSNDKPEDILGPGEKLIMHSIFSKDL